MLRAAASGQGIPGGPTQGRDPSSGRSGAWVENGKRIRKPERLLIHPSFAFHAPDGSERRPYHASHPSRVTGLKALAFRGRHRIYIRPGFQPSMPDSTAHLGRWPRLIWNGPMARKNSASQVRNCAKPFSARIRMSESRTIPRSWQGRRQAWRCPALPRVCWQHFRLWLRLGRKTSGCLLDKTRNL